MMRSLALALFAIAAVSAAPARAQSTEDPALARVDSLIAAGDLDQARERLDAWLASHPPGPGDAPPGAKAWALFLKARLASDWTAAEDALLSVVLGYPTAPHAPAALLLLGKGLIAAASTGKPATAAIRAASYLERLVNDYPGNPLHAEGQLWLARAYAASGRTAAGCGLLRQALPGANPDIAQSMRSDIGSACGAGVADSRATADSAKTVAPPPTAIANPDSTIPPEAAAPPRGVFTIQVAAMRSKQNAARLAEELARAGFNARVVNIQGSALVRVRVDTFADSRTAESLAVRIRARGFDAVVVNDVAREIRSP